MTVTKVTPLSTSNFAVFRRPGALWVVLDQPTAAAAFEIGGPKKAQMQAPKRTALGAATAFLGSIVPAWSARTVKVSEVFAKVA